MSQVIPGEEFEPALWSGLGVMSDGGVALWSLGLAVNTVFAFGLELLPWPCGAEHAVAENAMRACWLRVQVEEGFGYAVRRKRGKNDFV